MSLLSSPFLLRGVTLRNHIVMSPMCMYSAAEDGLATDFHLAHLAARAIGGVGMILTEATAVQPRGRISVNDLGLWNDGQMDPLRRIVQLCHSQGAVIGTQLAHAGRKAFSPRKGEGPSQPVAPSSIPHTEGWVVPHALAAEEIGEIVSAFHAAAQRAVAIGFDTIEIHSAHGYLLHEFLSPLSNQRNDEYGGSLKNRARALLEVVSAVREVLPADKPLIVRLSCTDWVAGGLEAQDLVQVAQWLKERGVDMIDCSSAGVTPAAPPTHPGYQVPFAERIRREAEIPTMAVGLITTPELAEEILQNGRADLIVLGRELLRHPNWALDAARVLGDEITWPQQYLRAKPGRR